MPDPVPPITDTTTITVRAIRQADYGGNDALHDDSFISITSVNIDIFAQVGGGDSLTILGFTIENGNLIVRHPDISFPFIFRPSDWNRASVEQQAAILKTIAEYDQSSRVRDAIEHMERQGISEVEVRVDDYKFNHDGTVLAPFRAGETGFISYVMMDNDPTGRDMQNGSRVVITLNDKLNGATAFAKAFMHELRHPFVPGIDDIDDDQIRDEEDVMFNEIFQTNGSDEDNSHDYLPERTVVGSRFADVVTSGDGNDTLAGLSGNDTLNGGGGNDLVMGGAGMDQLSGGLGSNAVLGGLEADTYIPAVGVTHEQVADIGGVDRIDLSSTSISSVMFSRFGDDLFIYAPDIAVESIGIAGQWLDGSRIEQFTFAEGTYAASYIESLAGQTSGVCYDPMGQPMFCSPYGLPVVFDLDGDGFDLIELSRSHVRFDVDGDGKAERVGWVGGDDGILALDRNGNGRIDDFSEISFRADFLGAGTDLEGLYAYDTDRDGFLTAADARFGEFVLWRDINANGHSEKREMFSLADLGIVSISLERSNVAALDRDAGANQVLATSSFTTADGALHRLGDVALFADIVMPTWSPGAQFEMLAEMPIA